MVSYNKEEERRTEDRTPGNTSVDMGRGRSYVSNYKYGPTREKDPRGGALQITAQYCNSSH